MDTRKLFEFAFGLVITASFGLVFVASYFLFHGVVVEARLALGYQPDLTVGWTLSMLIGALVVTVVFNFVFSDAIRTTLWRYFTGQ